MTRISIKLASALLCAALAAAQSLPGTRPLTLSGDPAQRMVAGISAYLDRETEASLAHRHPTRERLRDILGVVDPRVEFAPDLRKHSETASYTVYAARWPVLDGISGEGLLYEPKRQPVARVVALPDADQAPEDLQRAQDLAAQGALVLVPALLDRRDAWSGNPKFRMTNQPHREYIYRMAFPVGRHIIGYEVQKVLAAVDWFAKAMPKTPIEVWGYGEGGLIALHAAALDPRIDVATISGYFHSCQQLWKEPIYRNVWSFLRDFGDAELASMAKQVVVEMTPGPAVQGPDESDPRRRGAAPGVLEPASEESVRREVERARKLGARIRAVPGKGAASQRHGATSALSFRELVEYTQKIVRQSEARRDEYWSKADASSPERWRATTQPYHDRIWDDLIGRLPAPDLPANPRARLSYHDAKWDGYEVALDLWPDVFAYGVLLVPRNIRAGERRPVIVAQHGLEGRPQFLFGLPPQDRNFRPYQNIGSTLADLGFVVYLPQNPYIGDFRVLQRKANPLRLSLFSFILSQHARTLEWLATLPFVDPGRIGFYGLSYGGKTALRVPPLLDRYALSICSGDFNEWVVKLTTVDAPYSYMFTQEWEMPEYNLAHIANHAELAGLMAPRPFMVERGHRDGVGVDQWVAYEYAKVRRLYDEMGIGDRTAIEFFNGPHMIHGVGTVQFLKRFLNWP